MKGKLALVFGILVGCSGFVSAQPYYPIGAAPSADAQQVQAPGPALILKQGLQRLIAFIGSKERPDSRRIAAFLDQEIAPYFDFDYMARWAGGRLWQEMTPQQRREFEGQLQQRFLGTLAQRLGGYGGQQVRVMRARQGRNNEVTVDVAVMNPGSYPSRLKFRFYPSRDGWRIFDVSANGSSAVMYYRQYFSQKMRRQGTPSRGYRRGYPY